VNLATKFSFAKEKKMSRSFPNKVALSIRRLRLFSTPRKFSSAVLFSTSGYMLWPLRLSTSKLNNTSVCKKTDRSIALVVNFEKEGKGTLKNPLYKI